MFRGMTVRFCFTVQPVTVPRGVDLQVQVDPETVGRQTAVFAVCVHAFVTVKPRGLNSNVFSGKRKEYFLCGCIKLADKV